MPAKRRFTPDDLYLLKNVSDPQVSPDGKLVAYVVSWPDRDDDEYIPYTRYCDDDDCGSVDMAANVEERRRRYLARQRPPRSPWDDEAESA